jgi:hypothetical protein
MISAAFVAPVSAMNASVFQDIWLDVDTPGVSPEMHVTVQVTKMIDVAMEVQHSSLCMVMADQTTEETIKYDRYYRCSL